MAHTVAPVLPTVPLTPDAALGITPAVRDGIALPLSKNGRTRGLKYWCFTVQEAQIPLFEVPVDHEAFSYCVYQKEQCPQTGRLHLQGYLVLKTQTRFLQVKAMFSPCQLHLESRKARTHKPARDYCMKEDTRVDGPWEFGECPVENGGKSQADKIDWKSVREKVQAYTYWSHVLNTDDEELLRATAYKPQFVKELFLTKPVQLPDPGIELTKWEKKVIAILEGPPVHRQIIWIWSTGSKKGKTVFFTYCASRFRILPAAPQWHNTIYTYDGHHIIWFDRTRAESRDTKNVEHFYSDLEKLSNHTLHTSEKFVCVVKYVKCHIVVTANTPPVDDPDLGGLPERFLVIEAKTKEEEDEEEEAVIREHDAMIEDEYIRDMGKGNVPEDYGKDPSTIEEEDPMQLDPPGFQDDSSSDEIPPVPTENERREELNSQAQFPPHPSFKRATDIFRENGNQWPRDPITQEDTYSDDPEEADDGDEEPEDGESLGSQDTWSQ